MSSTNQKTYSYMPYYLENKDDFVSASDIMNGVIPTGAIGGGNTVFIIPDDYQAGTLMVFVDGMRLNGSLSPTPDYTLSGTGDQTITTAVAPTQWIIVAYVKLS